MQVLTPGHRYRLNHLDDSGGQDLQFVSRAPLHESIPGVTNQEVLRALIDRVMFLDSEVPWEGNQQIVHHLRMALVLHEARALIRKTERHQLEVEQIQLDVDGHFKLGIK